MIIGSQDLTSRLWVVGARHLNSAGIPDELQLQSTAGALAGWAGQATALDDVGLHMFLDLFAQRVRESRAPITHAELQRFLTAAKKQPRRGRGL